IHELGILLLVERRHFGFERHAADRTIPGRWAPDLRMHRTGVRRRSGGGRCASFGVPRRRGLMRAVGGMPLPRFHITRGIFLEALQAAVAAEEVFRAPVAVTVWSIRADFHAANRIDRRSVRRACPCARMMNVLAHPQPQAPRCAPPRKACAALSAAAKTSTAPA